MRQKRRAEITVETEQVVIIRPIEEGARRWCPTCAATVPMVTSDNAALLLGSSLRAICRQVEAGQLHFCETETGRLFICLHSITNHLTSDQGESL